MLTGLEPGEFGEQILSRPELILPVPLVLRRRLVPAVAPYPAPGTRNGSEARVGDGGSGTEGGTMGDIADVKARYDVVVGGGRVAGAATAMLLARAGIQVPLVEQGAPGTDTLSTLALMRGGVLQLSRWGLLDAVRTSGTPPSRAITGISSPVRPRA